MDGVLFVCHANLCRSPMAEHLARRLLPGVPVMFRSAGTHGTPGLAMHPLAAATLAEYGVQSDGFRSRPVDPATLNRAALVLTASRRQRAYCVSAAPATLHRTFTLRQFGRLAAAATPPGPTSPMDLLPTVVSAVARARGRVQPAPADADDLPDPVGGTAADFRRCAARIEAALRPVVDLIGTAG